MESKPLTVGRLKSYLQNYPDDALIMYEANEYPGDFRAVSRLDYDYEESLGRPSNTLLLK